MIGKKSYKIKFNLKKRTYTIRVYELGKLIAKYRSFPQHKDEFSTDWTEHDIFMYLRYSSYDYYKV